MKIPLSESLAIFLAILPVTSMGFPPVGGPDWISPEDAKRFRDDLSQHYRWSFPERYERLHGSAKQPPRYAAPTLPVNRENGGGNQSGLRLVMASTSPLFPLRAGAMPKVVSDHLTEHVNRLLLSHPASAKGATLELHLALPQLMEPRWVREEQVELTAIRVRVVSAPNQNAKTYTRGVSVTGRIKVKNGAAYFDSRSVTGPRWLLELDDSLARPPADGKVTIPSEFDELVIEALNGYESGEAAPTPTRSNDLPGYPYPGYNRAETERWERQRRYLNAP